MSAKGKSSDLSDQLIQTPYEILRRYQDTGDETLISQELRIYIDQLNLVRQAHDKYESRAQIVALLRLAYPGLAENMYSALFEDALNFFYADSRVKKETWRNIYAKQLDDVALLALERDDFKSFREMKKLAAEIRGLMEPDKPELPEDIFDRKIEIITANPQQLGAKAVSKAELIKRLEQFKLDQVSVNRAVRDAGFAEGVLDDEA